MPVTAEFSRITLLLCPARLSFWPDKHCPHEGSKVTDTHINTPTRFVEVDGEKFAYRRWDNTATDQPPLFFFQHFRGGMDHWDPLMTDGLAAGREVILFNGRGVASSSGKPRTRIEDMADDAAAAIRAIGLSKVDVLGFSLGGFQAQDLTRRHPDLVRRLMLLGTGPRGGNPDSEPGVLERAPRPVPTVDDFLYLFFGRSEAAKQAGRAFWERRHVRKDQDPPSSPAVIQAQIEANMYYLPKLDARAPFAHLREIKQPTFILNGVNDVMIPSINSWHMAQNIPNAQLFIYPDAGHAAQFQFPDRFLKHAVQFLGE
ncbi:MAG: alpha/beta hydrolase [Rhodoferax sp.]|nr:alpha/beta hydrolase [Rhodoferax sp.]MBP7572908.1 alpha/beta hydrolase [Rhodoferax sp.]